MLENIYEYWIENNIKNRLKTAKYESEKEQYQNLIDEYKEYKKDKSDFDISDFWMFQGDRWIGGIKAPVYYQGRYFCHFYTNVMSTDRFEFEKPWCDARIYLNIKTQNTVQLANVMIDKAIQKNIPLTFKFAFFDERNDNFVLYSEYKHMDSLVNLIDETKKENPNLFAGCEVKNPLMAALKGYMGFGEEPFTFDSYNSVRADILEGTYKKLSEQYIQDKDSLTKENIVLAFQDQCNKNQIDSENFYLNKPDRCFDLEK